MKKRRTIAVIDKGVKKTNARIGCCWGPYVPLT